MKYLWARSAALLLLSLSLSMPVSAEELPGPVVSAQWLSSHRQDVVILDVRDDLDGWTTAPEYEKDERTGAQKLSAPGGHIEGALPILMKKLRVDRVVDGRRLEKMLPDRAYIQELMQSSGVVKAKPIVITSTGDAPDQVDSAARLYWTLKTYGAEQLAILDGGNAAWLSVGLPISTDRVPVTRGDWEAAAERHDWLADIGDIEVAVKKRQQIVDARPLPQYLGLVFKKPTVSAGGHVTGALNYPTDVRTRSSGVAYVFLKPEEYRAVMKSQGIADQAPTITYCNTGHMAAGSWFIQSEILKVNNVRLYDGSMHEWTLQNKPLVSIGG